MEAGLFDKTFYLNSYPHVKESGMDPLVHYLFYGYSEGKLPNETFNHEIYIEKYPEIKEKDINPLIYYIDNNSFLKVSYVRQNRRDRGRELVPLEFTLIITNYLRYNIITFFRFFCFFFWAKAELASLGSSIKIGTGTCPA